MSPTTTPGRWHRVLRRTLVTGAVALLATATIASPAHADGKSPNPSTPHPTGAVPAGFDSWAEVYQVQDKLNAAATEITKVDSAGNASIVAAPESRTLVVHWNGVVPTSIRTLAKGLGVPVSFRPAAYTHAELVTEAQRLATDARVIEAAPKADGSGLAVTATAGSVDRAGLQAAARVPLSITTGERPQALFSRQDDVPWFWGGSRYNTPTGGCSNGFGLRVNGAPNVYEISAGHCGNNGQGATIPGQPSPTGTLIAKSTCRDTLVINYPAGVANRIYTGPFNSSTSAQVLGAGFDFVGNLIQTGGASSGEHFNIPVQAVDTFVGVGGIPCTTVGPLTRAGYAGAVCAVAPGDSGGPAYAYSGAGVVGRGTITAGNLGSAVCPGVVPNGANTVWYAPLLRPGPQIGSLQFYGVGILT